MPGFLQRLIVVVILLGTYTNFAVNIGVLLYGFFPLVAGGLLFVRYAPASRPILQVFAALFCVCVVVDLGSASFPSDVTNLVQSTALLLAGVATGLGLFAELRRWPRRTLGDILLAGCVTVVVLGYCERFAPVAEFSDSVREVLYSADGQFLYSSDERDMFFYGTVRPKIFTQEPSHPAKFIAFAGAAWFLLTTRRHRLTVAAILFALATYVLRSPSLFAGPALVLYSWAFGVNGRFQRAPITARLCVVAAAVVAVVMLPEWISIVPTPRSADIAQGADVSSIVRLVGAREVAVELVRESPFFGVGIGGKDYAWDTVLSVYASFPGVDLEQFYLSPDVGWGNAFFQCVAYCGLLGTAAFLWWITFLSKKLVTFDWPAMLMTFFVSFNLDGAVNLVRPWVYFFLVAVAYHMSMRDAVLGIGSAPPSLSHPSPALHPHGPGNPAPRYVTPGVADRAA
jgi:hypothetical protein